MDNRHHIGVSLIDLPMDVPLRIQVYLALRGVNGLTVEVEYQDVLRCDERGRKRP